MDLEEKQKKQSRTRGEGSRAQQVMKSFFNPKTHEVKRSKMEKVEVQLENQEG
jgi:hypothetical protein